MFVHELQTCRMKLAQVLDLVSSIWPSEPDDPSDCLRNRCGNCEAYMRDHHLCKVGGADRRGRDAPTRHLRRPTCRHAVHPQRLRSLRQERTAHSWDAAQNRLTQRAVHRLDLFDGQSAIASAMNHAVAVCTHRYKVGRRIDLDRAAAPRDWDTVVNVDHSRPIVTVPLGEVEPAANAGQAVNRDRLKPKRPLRQPSPRSAVLDFLQSRSTLRLLRWSRANSHFHSSHQFGSSRPVTIARYVALVYRANGVTPIVRALALRNALEVLAITAEHHGSSSNWAYPSMQAKRSPFVLVDLERLDRSS